MRQSGEGRTLEIFNDHIIKCKPDYQTHKLTGHLRDNYFHIKTLAEFKAVEEQFVDAVGRFCVVSFDTECRRGVENPWDALESYLIGTYDGSTFDFSIPDLRKEALEQQRLTFGDLATVLPSTVTQALEDRRIIKLGSDAGRDAFQDEDMGLNVGPLVCTQVLHGLVDGMSPSNDLVSGAPGTCNGLGRIAYDIFGVTHKIDTKRFDQPKAWRKHARFTLYDWAKPLSEYTFLYRALDAALPLLLLSWTLRSFIDEHLVSKELVCGKFNELLHAVAKPALVKGVPFWTRGTAKNASRCVGKICRIGTGSLPEVLASADPGETRETRKKEADQAEKEGGLDELSDDEVLEVQIVEEEEEELVVDAVGGMEVVQEDEEVVVLEVKERAEANEAVLTSLDLQLTTEEMGENGMERSEEEDPTVNLKRRKDKRMKRRAPKSSFKYAKGIREDNKYKFKPKLHRWCSFCAKTTHSRRDRDKKPMCPAFRRHLRTIVRQQPVEQECLYKHCDNRTEHRTNACPVLASRCETCWLRGHQAKQCLRSAEAQRRFLQDFEEYADCHPLLRHRFQEPAWGFFRVKKTHTAAYSYEGLLKADISYAIHLTMSD